MLTKGRIIKETDNYYQNWSVNNKIYLVTGELCTYMLLWTKRAHILNLTRSGEAYAEA